MRLYVAVETACDRFLTNDAQLLRYPGLTVEVV
jgi:hypothetical protein